MAKRNTYRLAADDKGQMTVQQDGKMGGRATAETHDHDFFDKIGRMGDEKGGLRVRELINEDKEAETQAPASRHTKSDYDHAA